MVAKQVIFKELFAEDCLLTGGIAIYEDFGQGKDCPFLELQGVICGECGEWINAEYVEIYEDADYWESLDEAIQNIIRPDNTRSFRPENQIRMELD